MKHVGDITQIHGWELPIVDCITGGSPCQDVSIAGYRQGLAGERSGLFFDQIRVVKEMRQHDRQSNGRAGIYVRPRYMVLENVPGLLSSNGGKDFQTVLTEIVKIVRPESPVVPLFGNGGGRWQHSGCLMGIGDSGLPFSVAWRVHDAQFWGKTLYTDGRVIVSGTPQRRRRIALVADFNGLSAPEILFIRQGSCGDLAQIEGEKQTATQGTGRSIDKAISFQERSGKPGGGEGNPDTRRSCRSTLNTYESDGV